LFSAQIKSIASIAPQENALAYTIFFFALTSPQSSVARESSKE
jgi:hypothetical protein